MTKQEFMAFSLPYGLKVKYITDRIQHYSATKYEAEFDNIFEVIKSMPILRNISDLTKTIEHKGEKFVPIEELCKISGYNPKNYIIKENKEIKSIGLEYIRYGCVFQFAVVGLDFKCIIKRSNGNIEHVINQLQLFQKLIEWHFDIAALIEKNEAIDVNTLEINPYK